MPGRWLDRNHAREPMPTNILRKSASRRAPARNARASSAPRLAQLTAGRISIRIELADTPTADVVWQGLPLYSTAETWGDSIHFETPLEAGRDRTARLNGVPGEIYFWTEEDRIIIPFGRTPVSRPGESRLQRPSNLWARALDDVRALAAVTPGEKVTLIAIT